MSFLAKFGKTALKIVGIATGFMPLIQGTVQGTEAANVVNKITDDLTKVSSCILTVETVIGAISAPGVKTGAQKLQAAVPLVAQVIQQSEIMSGKKIHDEAKFIAAVTGITSNMADLLNAIE